MCRKFVKKTASSTNTSCHELFFLGGGRSSQTFSRKHFGTPSCSRHARTPNGWLEHITSLVKSLRQKWKGNRDVQIIPSHSLRHGFTINKKPLKTASGGKMIQRTHTWLRWVSCFLKGFGGLQHTTFGWFRDCSKALVGPLWTNQCIIWCI